MSGSAYQPYEHLIDFEAYNEGAQVDLGSAMSKYLARLSLVFLLTASAPAQLAIAGEASPEIRPGDEIPLDEADLRMITLQVLERNPLLSSSPGIRFASAVRQEPSTDAVDIIFNPHAEIAGVRHAFQVHCSREIPSELWTCGEVRLRRYVQLESQDFEVRVVGALGIEQVLALIQATRRVAQASASDGSTIPDTAIMVLPTGDGYVVNWGTDEGYGKLLVQAQLKKSGNAAKPEDWQTTIFEEPE